MAAFFLLIWLLKTMFSIKECCGAMNRLHEVTVICKAYIYDKEKKCV